MQQRIGMRTACSHLCNFNRCMFVNKIDQYHWVVGVEIYGLQIGQPLVAPSLLPFVRGREWREVAVWAGKKIKWYSTCKCSFTFYNNFKLLQVSRKASWLKTKYTSLRKIIKKRNARLSLATTTAMFKDRIKRKSWGEFKPLLSLDGQVMCKFYRLSRRSLRGFVVQSSLAARVYECCAWQIF